MSTEPAGWAPELENWIVALSRTVLNTVALAIVTVAPVSNREPVIVPHVPAVVTTLGETPAMVGCSPIGDGAGATAEGGLAGADPGGAGSDDGMDGEGGNPPHAAVVNVSSIPIVVSFKFALPAATTRGAYCSTHARCRCPASTTQS